MTKPRVPHHSRRDFMQYVASAAGASIVTPAVAAAQGRGRGAAQPAAPPVNPNTPIQPMKLGVFGIDLTFWGIWADLLSPQGRYVGTSLLRMRPTHIWDKDTAKAQDFARRWGCEVVDRYDAMLGKVDAVLNGDLYNTPWQHLLMRPYLEAGVPCFLQRHWSDTIGHLDEMLDLSAKHNTPIMATVPFEHYPQTDALIAKLKSVGEINSVFGTAEIADEPHFHLPYMALKVLGYDVDWVSMTADDVRRVGYLNINYGYGKTESRPRPFVASLQGARPDVVSMTINGQQGTISASMPGSASYYTRFFDQLVDIQKSFEKKTQYQPADVIRKKYLCLQAAYYSQTERGGAPVKIGSVPADWKLPAWRADWYDGSEFRK
jgi:predicted dehydrogenase